MGVHIVTVHLAIPPLEAAQLFSRKPAFLSRRQ